MSDKNGLEKAVVAQEDTEEYKTFYFFSVAVERSIRRQWGYLAEVIDDLVSVGYMHLWGMCNNGLTREDKVSYVVSSCIGACKNFLLKENETFNSRSSYEYEITNLILKYKDIESKEEIYQRWKDRYGKEYKGFWNIYNKLMNNVSYDNLGFPTIDNEWEKGYNEIEYKSLLEDIDEHVFWKYGEDKRGMYMSWLLSKCEGIKADSKKINYRVVKEINEDIRSNIDMGINNIHSVKF